MNQENVAIIPIERYNELRDFERDIKAGKVVVSHPCRGDKYYLTTDKAIEEIKDYKEEDIKRLENIIKEIDKKSKQYQDRVEELEQRLRNETFKRALRELEIESRPKKRFLIF